MNDHNLSWKTALENLAGPVDKKTGQQLVAFLHDAVSKGNLEPQAFMEQSEILYRRTTDVRLSAEIKRMQNRIRCRKIQGQDLLRMQSPPTGDRDKKALWETLQQLKHTYDRYHQEIDCLESRYELCEEIGEGSMGKVIRAVRRKDSQPVAIKFLHEGFMDHPTAPARFARESRLCLAFDHPHVVKVFESGQHNKKAFMIMPYMPLGSIEKYMGCPHLDARTIIAVLRQTAQALVYIHQQSIVHRDIKPANILVARWPAISGENGKQAIEVQLGDFGISKEVRVNDFTRAGAKMGTPLYVAPEQREAPEKVDHRADIFALGVTMYRLFSGKGYPYGEYPSLNEINSKLPVEIDKLLAMCLQPEPDRRLADAQDFDDTLAGIEIEMNRKN